MYAHPRMCVCVCARPCVYTLVHYLQISATSLADKTSEAGIRVSALPRIVRRTGERHGDVIQKRVSRTSYYRRRDKRGSRASESENTGVTLTAAIRHRKPASSRPVRALCSARRMWSERKKVPCSCRRLFTPPAGRELNFEISCVLFPPPSLSFFLSRSVFLEQPSLLRRE